MALVGVKRVYLYSLGYPAGLSFLKLSYRGLFSVIFCCCIYKKKFIYIYL